MRIKAAVLEEFGPPLPVRESALAAPRAGEVHVPPGAALWFVPCAWRHLLGGILPAALFKRAAPPTDA